MKTNILNLLISYIDTVSFMNLILYRYHMNHPSTIIIIYYAHVLLFIHGPVQLLYELFCIQNKPLLFYRMWIGSGVLVIVHRVDVGCVGYIGQLGVQCVHSLWEHFLGIDPVFAHARTCLIVYGIMHVACIWIYMCRIVGRWQIDCEFASMYMRIRVSDQHVSIPLQTIS